MDRPEPCENAVTGLNPYLTGAAPVLAYVKLLLDIAAVLGLSYYAAHLIVDLLLLGEGKSIVYWYWYCRKPPGIALCCFLLVMCIRSIGEKLGRGEQQQQQQQQRQTGWDKRRSKHKNRLECMVRLEVNPE